MSLAIHLATYVSGGYTGNTIRWKLIEISTSIVNDTHEEPGPHGTTYRFSFTDSIRDIPYRLELYSVPPAASVGSLIKSWDITPTTNTLVLDADMELIVGGGEDYDPVAGDFSVTIADLIGKDIYLMQRGIGQLRYVRVPEYEFDDTTGEISLVGNRFNDGDTFIVKFRPQFIVNPPGTQQATSIYKDVVLKTENFSVVSADFGKKFIIDADAKVVNVKVDEILTIIQKVPIFFESVGTEHVNVVIEAATDETIQSFTESQTFILGRGEKAELIRLGDIMYAFSDSLDIKKAGQIEWGYYLSANRLWADGSEYDCADYPRLKKAMDATGSGVVKTYTQWAATATVNGVAGVSINKGFFALSNDGLKFKVPDLRNKFVRGLKNNLGTDTERVENKPGGYQDSMFKEHGHDLLTGGDGTPADPGKTLIRQSYNGDGYTSGASSLGPYVEEVGGVETRGENIGLIPMIII
jgi:hypothetical protein